MRSTLGRLASTSWKHRGRTATSGDADLYENDDDAHWTTSRAEYQWLQHDLATHPRPLAFAFFHFPLYSDSASEGSDPFLHGDGHLEELLGEHGVDIVFNGHAHFYERNHRSGGGMPVSYVTGGGGADLEPVSHCSSIDAYAIGWSYSSSPTGALAAQPLALPRSARSSISCWSGSTARP
jgi:hypothetical protein